MAKASPYSAPINYAIGAEVITDTLAHTGRFSHVCFFKNSKIDQIESTNITDSNFADADIDKCGYIEGYITSIKLKNGGCIAYKI